MTTNDIAMKAMKDALGIAELEQGFSETRDQLDELRQLLEDAGDNHGTLVNDVNMIGTRLERLEAVVRGFGAHAGAAQLQGWANQLEELSMQTNASHGEIMSRIAELESRVDTHDTMFDNVRDLLAQAAGQIGTVGESTARAHDRLDVVERRVDLIADREIPWWTYVAAAVAGFVAFLIWLAIDFSSSTAVGEQMVEVNSKADSVFVSLIVGLGIAISVFCGLIMYVLLSKPNGYDEAHRQQGAPADTADQPTLPPPPAQRRDQPIPA